MKPETITPSLSSGKMWQWNQWFFSSRHILVMYSHCLRTSDVCRRYHGGSHQCVAQTTKYIYWFECLDFESLLPFLVLSLTVSLTYRHVGCDAIIPLPFSGILTLWPRRCRYLLDKVKWYLLEPICESHDDVLQCLTTSTYFFNNEYISEQGKGSRVRRQNSIHSHPWDKIVHLLFASFI